MGLNKRAIFEQLRDKYANIGKGDIRFSESSLVLIQAISSNKQVYQFPVLDTESTPLANEIRLNMNDEFTGVSLGIYVGGYLYNDTDNTGSSSFMLWPYAPIELDGRAIAIAPLWDGSFSFGVNKVTYLEKWRTRKHWKVPTTQFAVQPVPAAGPPVIGNSYPATIPSVDLQKDGMVDLNSVITFSGAKKNNVSIDLPSALTSTTVVYKDQQATPDSNYVHLSHIVVVVDGFLAQNGAQFQGPAKARR